MIMKMRARRRQRDADPSGFAGWHIGRGEHQSAGDNATGPRRWARSCRWTPAAAGSRPATEPVGASAAGQRPADDGRLPGRRDEAPPCMRWRGLAGCPIATTFDYSTVALRSTPTSSEDLLEVPVSRPFSRLEVAPQVVFVLRGEVFVLPPARRAQGVCAHHFKILLSSTGSRPLSPAQSFCPLVIHTSMHSRLPNCPACRL
jgi:hypothetical protein